jgi:bacillithiol biosynthesis cysteine-adding enzyme BshC
MLPEIHVQRLEGPRLALDYQAGAPALAPFFTGSPRDPAAYRRKAGELRRRFHGDQRRRIAGALRASSPAASARLERVLAEDGFFVTTGQQAGLFTGPLYTIYKALTAARLAEHLERVLDVPVAPLFWVAADDHDWEEVDHVHLLDPANQLHRIALAAPADAPPASMARRRVGPGIEATSSALGELLPDTAFKAEVLELIRAAYRPEATVAGAFRDMLERLLAPFDVLLVDSADPLVKELACPVLEREAELAAEHEARVAAQTDRLVAAGYHAQVAVGAGASNIFYEDEGGRERLVRADGGWQLRRTKRSFDDDELRVLLRAAPERFTPNVLLRPVVESALFPTLAYVAGPGELSYYGQIGCLFRGHDIDMPLVYPRASVVIVEGKVRKVLDKFDLTPEDFRQPVHELVSRVAREELPAEVTASLDFLRRSIGDGYQRLAGAAAQIDPTLGPSLGGARHASLSQVEEVEKKIVGHLKKRNAIVLEQVEKAHANLRPTGQAQERVLNVVQYLARYGTDLLGAVHRAIAVEVEAASPAWAGVECA